jgi:hypothetical protein
MRNDEFVLDETGMQTWRHYTASFQSTYTVPGNAKLRIDSEWFQLFCEGQENYYIQNVLNQTVVDRLEEQR